MESQSTKKITIHQTLHGYSDGHRLLANSRKLPPDVSRLIGVLSDLSGASIIPGFENYLTGYPLPKLDSYAFARTWYAAEMSRPGCVWTQTLLIEFADLAIITDLSELLICFERPVNQNSNWLESYEHSISLNVEAETTLSTRSELPDFASTLLQNLYRNPQQGIVALIDDAAKCEQLTLWMWSQQWPRLRRSFKFCTGALSLRQIDGTDFDLQFHPTILANQLHRTNKPANNLVILTLAPNSKSGDSSTQAEFVEPWIGETLADLRLATKTKLREFLWRYGTFAKGGRVVFRPLSEIFQRLQELERKPISDKTTNLFYQELQAIADLLGGYYSKRDEEVELKTALFSSSSSSLRSWSNLITEENLLSALITTKHPESFDAKSLTIGLRAREFQLKQPIKATHLALEIIEKKQNSLNEEFLKGIFEVIAIPDALKLNDKKPGILETIVTAQPDLVFHLDIWKTQPAIQQKIFETNIGTIKTNEDNIRKLIATLLEAGNDTYAEPIAQCISSEIFVAAILEWCNQPLHSNSQIIGSEWYRLLSIKGRQVFEWMRQQNIKILQVKTLVLITTILDPHDWKIIDTGPDCWEGLTDYIKHHVDDSNLVKAATFLLALGFNNPLPSGVKLIVGSFETVFKAAKENYLDSGSWSYLEYQAPSNSFWNEWDRCDRLCHALVNTFLKFDWPNDEFLRVTTDHYIFNQIIECADYSNRGRRFIKDMVRQIKGGQLRATNTQISILTAHKFF